MALRLTGATTTIAVALGSTPSSGTTGAWYRRAGTPAGESILFALGRGIIHAATTLMRSGGDAPDPVVHPADGDWVYLAVIRDGNNWGAYAFTDQTTQDAQTVQASSYYPGSASDVEIGDYDGIYGAGLTNAEYLHMRTWSSVLSLAELNAEKNSATPVITSGLIHATSFATDLTSSTGNNATNSGAGYEFTENVPIALAGGGASIVPQAMAQYINQVIQ
jgi:hypothetical protein